MSERRESNGDAARPFDNVRVIRQARSYQDWTPWEGPSRQGLDGSEAEDTADQVDNIRSLDAFRRRRSAERSARQP